MNDELRNEPTREAAMAAQVARSKGIVERLVLVSRG
jgi:hypothetical protein